MVPMIRELGMTLKRAGIVKTAGDGNSMLTASILLGMMILPTIIGVTESAIRSVPNQYYEGALALEQRMKEVFLRSFFRRQNQAW